ncbi:hypothetical protein [Actinocorallia aurantiaca]|uniref:Uncharacterized protein n=1 Tax=Actinocorallia aurantiaca TaxID=46204 RepID=A0ABN3UKQ1_9ACTN
MDSEIQLIGDDDGLEIFEDPAAVEKYPVSEGPSSSKDLGPGLKYRRNQAAVVVVTASVAAVNFRRWLMITKGSAQHAMKFGLVKGKDPRTLYAMAGKAGSIKSWLQVEKGLVSRLAHPSTLAVVAGCMALAALHARRNHADALAELGKETERAEETAAALAEVRTENKALTLANKKLRAAAENALEAENARVLAAVAAIRTDLTAQIAEATAKAAAAEQLARAERAKRLALAAQLATARADLDAARRTNGLDTVATVGGTSR